MVKKMKIDLLNPYGYCKGVINAINLVKKTRENNPNTPVYIWGNLVHNEHVTNALKKNNVITIENNLKEKSFEILSKLDKGFLITTAHGANMKVVQDAKKLGFTHISATCPIVSNIEKQIKMEIENNKKDVLYFGIKNHPELEAMISINPDKIHAIYTKEDLEKYNFKDISCAVQTTLLIEDLKGIKKIIPESNFLNTICNETTIRQTNLYKIKNLYYDTIIIVGDKKSNNTNELYRIALKKSNKVMFINEANELKKEIINENEKILIVSGASTPKEIVDQIINYIKMGIINKIDDKKILL